MKSKKRIARTAACLLIPAIIVMSFIAGVNIRTSSPDNPLLNKADSFAIDETNGGTLGLSEDVLSAAKQSDKDGDSSSGTDSSYDRKDNSDSENKNSTSRNENINTPSFPGIKDNDSHRNTLTDVRSGESDKINSDISGDNRTPSPNKTNTDYFSTTIKDGETVFSRSYSFKITHNHKELKAKSTTVFVNGTKQAGFSGRVLLNEGKNLIRVEITYTDINSKVISVYRDYTVNVELGEIIITTDLTDRTVDTNSIFFSANAAIDGESLPLNVTCNGNRITSSNGQYSAKLSENENVITLSAQWQNKSISKSFTVTYIPAKAIEIKTSLTNCTVNDSSFSFSAYTINGTAQSRLSVAFNGSALSPANNYRVNLKTGSNSIRLKADDVVNGERVSITQDYIIRYVPLADEKTAPRIEHINISDDMTIKGSDYCLDILPVDYLRNRIFCNGISVRLNGSVVSHESDSKYTSYYLYLNGGLNRLDIRISDSAGRYTDYSFDINCLAVADGEEIGSVTISTDANVLGLGYIIPPEKITIRQGETAAATVLKYLEEHGFTCNYSGDVNNGFYLSRISKKGIGLNVSIPQELVNELNKNGFELNDQSDDNSIGEFDYSQCSGWIYSINGEFNNCSLSKAVLKDGYELRIRFSLAYGKDIGGGYDLGYNSNFDKTW